MFKASSDLFNGISSALAKKIDRNAQELTDREIRIFADHLVDRFKELETEKSNLENNLAEAEAERDREHAAHVDSEGRVQKLQVDKSRLEKDLDDAKSKSDQLENRVAARESQVDRLNDAKDKLQEDNSRLKAENAELFGDKNNLEVQMRGLREDSVPRKDYDDLKSRLRRQETQATLAETRLAVEEKARRSREASGHTESEETIDLLLIGGGRLTDAWRLLNDKQEPAYALVAAMCDVECILRQVLDDPELDWHTSLEMTLQNGYISPEQRDGLERRRERRNQILHGMVPLQLEESQARNDLAYLEQVIGQLGA